MGPADSSQPFLHFPSTMSKGGGKNDESWAVVASKNTKKALADAKRASKAAEEAAEQAKAALRLAQKAGKGKGKTSSKGIGKGPTGLPAGAWICPDPACLKNLKHTNPSRGPCVNKKDALWCSHCNAPKGLYQIQEAAKEAQKKEEARAELESLREKNKTAGQGAQQQRQLQQPGTPAGSAPNGALGQLATTTPAAVACSASLQFTQAASALKNPVRCEEAAKQLSKDFQAHPPAPKGEKLALPSAPEYEKVEAVLGPARTLLAEFTAPGPLPERYSSTKANVEFLLTKTRKAGPLDRAAELQKLEEQVKSCKSTLVLLEQNPLLSAEAETVRGKLATAEAELTRRKKDTPTAASEHKALEETLSSLATAIEERKGRADKGRKKAEERRTRRKTLFDELRQQLDAAEQAAETLENKACEQHVARTTHLEKLERETKEALQQKVGVALLKAKADEDEAKKKAAASTNSTAASTQADPMDAVQQAQLSFQQEIEQLEQRQAAQIAELRAAFAQEQATAAATAAAAAEEARKTSQNARHLQELTLAYEKRAEVTLDSLPSIMIPADEAAISQLASTHALLVQWAGMDNPTPFTFADLVTHAPLAAEAPKFVRAALGDSWYQWFIENPSTETVIPKQVAYLLRDTLQRTSDSWENSVKAEEIAKQAAGSFASLAGATKKRRAILLDAEMTLAASSTSTSTTA